MKLNTKRIRYDKKGLSEKIVTHKGIFQIQLDIMNMSFKIINATNNLKLFEKSGTKSLHVLKRWAKRELSKLADISFEKEKRPARLGMKTWEGK
jgi:hypothetical protein